jgi:O-succinylbenzoate synthase
VTAPERALPAVDDLEVVRADVHLVRLQLRRPHLAAHGTVDERLTVLVHVELASGATGWGECPALATPSYTAEYAAGAFALLRDSLLPARLAQAPLAAAGHPMASAALADALLDGALRERGQQLVDVLGGVRRRVDGRTIVSGDDLDQLLGVIGGVVDRGGRAIGLKVRPGWLEEPVAAVRAAWPALGISVDANGSLGAVDDATWQRLGRHRLDEVEQPCAPGDWLGSARVAGCLDCPVVLDEGITTAHDLRTATVLGAATVVNVKPARVGGIARAVRLVAQAADAGFGAFVGGMLESGVGRSSALALATLPGCDRPTHLGPSSQYWVEDLTAPVGGDAGPTVDVPAVVGAALAPDPERLGAATVESASLTP